MIRIPSSLWHYLSLFYMTSLLVPDVPLQCGSSGKSYKEISLWYNKETAIRKVPATSIAIIECRFS